MAMSGEHIKVSLQWRGDAEAGARAADEMVVVVAMMEMMEMMMTTTMAIITLFAARV